MMEWWKNVRKQKQKRHHENTKGWRRERREIYIEKQVFFHAFQFSCLRGKDCLPFWVFAFPIIPSFHCSSIPVAGAALTDSFCFHCFNFRLFWHFRHYWGFEKLSFQDTVFMHLLASCLLYLDTKRSGEISGQTGERKSAGSDDPGSAGTLRRTLHG